MCGLPAVAVIVAEAQRQGEVMLTRRTTVMIVSRDTVAAAATTSRCPSVRLSVCHTLSVSQWLVCIDELS